MLESVRAAEGSPVPLSQTQMSSFGALPPEAQNSQREESLAGQG